MAKANGRGAPRTGLSIKCPHCDGSGRLALERASVGTMILAARKAHDMTQEELAGKVQSRCFTSRTQPQDLWSGRR